MNFSHVSDFKAYAVKTDEVSDSDLYLRGMIHCPGSPLLGL
uniref:Uncharacterized protein n=1 Tax=Rhizophora mucronata TaxID=61149 RepID=A0A2P2P1Q2_RHIMU